MTAFALYDLDRTILRHASFTPFLLFAARKRAPWRLMLAPIWLLAMLGYKLGLYPRGELKQFGLRLFLGGQVTEADLADLGQAFAKKVVPAWIGPGASAAICADRKAGRELILVTAAMRFYAEPIARRLGFSRVLATHHAELLAPGPCALEGENCYGAQKVSRIEALLAENGLARAECHLVFYSDSVSDAPLFDFSDEAVLVDASRRGLERAERSGWRVARFNR